MFKLVLLTISESSFLAWEFVWLGLAFESSQTIAMDSIEIEPKRPEGLVFVNVEYIYVYISVYGILTMPLRFIIIIC